MDELDNVKLISLFQTFGAEVSSVPLVSHFTVRLNTDVRAHLQGRAIRVVVRAWDKSLSRALWSWKVRVHSTVQDAPSTTAVRRRFRPLKKPVLKPEKDEALDVWRITVGREGAVQIRAAALKNAIRSFRTCLRQIFYRWKLSRPSDQVSRPIRSLARVLVHLRLKRLKEALQNMGASEAKSSISLLLNKSFELNPSEKVSFHLGDSLDINLEEPHYLPLRPSRLSLLRTLLQRLNLRWHFSLKVFLYQMKDKLKGKPRGLVRVAKAVRLQALARGFLARVRVRYMVRLQRLFQANSMWLLALFLQKNVRKSLAQPEKETDIRARVAYSLRFKRLMARARRPAVQVIST
jgi:hypothetical protein